MYRYIWLYDYDTGIVLAAFNVNIIGMTKLLLYMLRGFYVKTMNKSS